MSHNKDFAERLNKALDDIEVPQRGEERIRILGQLIKVRNAKAKSLLDGSALPDPKLLDVMAKELEVSATWLLGRVTPKLLKRPLSNHRSKN